MNPITYITHYILILQLENYNIRRFLRASIHTVSRARQPKRQTITWTKKLVAVCGDAGLLAIIVALILGFMLGQTLIPMAIIALIALYIFALVFPIFLVAILTPLAPFDAVVKHIIIRRAKNKIAALPNLTIIGIAGSYGKTTMKEMVSTLLEEKYTVVKTPENINRSVGIARLIQSEVNEKTDILVIELGEYTQGDIAEMTQLVPPHIGIITGINEAHLEHMKSMERTVDTIFELADTMRNKGTLILNTDDARVMTHYKTHLTKKPRVHFYGENTHAVNIVFDAKGSTFTINEQTFTIPFLARYAVGTFTAAYITAQKLKLTESEIQNGVKKLTPIPHRLEPIQNESADILVIDDSYNGNPAGVREALDVLARFKDKRKIYLTPGLVELGAASKKIHYTMGSEIAAVADLVLLIETSVTPDILRGLQDAGFDRKKIRICKTAQDAHAELPIITRPGDVVLFQNDWTDNYY